MNNVAWHKDEGVGFLHERILRPNHSVVATISNFDVLEFSRTIDLCGLHQSIGMEPCEHV